MKRLLFVLALAVTLLWNAAPVLAACGPWTLDFDGRICQICCNERGECVLTCV